MQKATAERTPPSKGGVTHNNQKVLNASYFLTPRNFSLYGLAAAEAGLLTSFRFPTPSHFIVR